MDNVTIALLIREAGAYTENSAVQAYVIPQSKFYSKMENVLLVLHAHSQVVTESFARME